MKNTAYFLVLTLFLSLSIGSASATVFRVNNGLTENIMGRLFTEIKTAHDHINVKNGDTLMVEGSEKVYLPFICTKRLAIIGPGYFLGDNNGVNSIVASAKVSDGLRFQEGSQGSYIIGIETTGANFALQTSNLYVIRCKAVGLAFDRASNCKVVMSYIGKIYGYNFANTNISITNCVIDSDNSRIPYVNYDNNILVGNSYTWNFSSGTFRNNILIERDAKVNIKSPNFQNNLAQNGQFGTDNGNQIYELADLFVGGTSNDGKYQIRANSKYVAAGYNGTQPGIFGGSDPYRLSGVPPIPIIYDLNVPGTGSTAAGLNINVKIRGANKL